MGWRGQNSFLARAGLTLDKHRGIRDGDLFHVAQHLPQRRALPDDFIKVVERANLSLQILGLHRKRLNAALGGQPFVNVAQNECVKDLPANSRNATAWPRRETGSCPQRSAMSFGESTTGARR